MLKKIRKEIIIALISIIISSSISIFFINYFKNEPQYDFVIGFFTAYIYFFTYDTLKEI